MTDAHCHLSCGDNRIREFLIGRDFFGIHPWEATGCLGDVEKQLQAHPEAGVGEIGLDRLKSRDIAPAMRERFEQQLLLGLRLRRPIVLHGAKCWGQVVRTVQRLAAEIGIRHLPPILFHGFSRSDGLIPDIVALNGFISVGPAVLNDHAVNYRELVRKIPADRLLVETDRTAENAATCPSVREVLAKVAALRDIPIDELERLTDQTANHFLTSH